MEFIQSMQSGQRNLAFAWPFLSCSWLTLEKSYCRAARRFFAFFLETDGRYFFLEIRFMGP